MMDPQLKYGDWQSGMNLQESNKFMLHNKICCDVTFLLGKCRQDVQAHRYMLASRSSVFFAMLYGPFENNDKPIEIPDIEKDIFELLLSYMYHEEITINGDNVTHLLYASRKYGITKVTHACKLFLKDNFSPDNVCIILENAHIFDEEELYQLCLDYIFQHPFESLQSEHFTNLCRGCITKIVSSDNLALDEDHVLNCMTSWGIKECDRQGLISNEENCRQVLSDLFYLIRFPIMDLTYFADHVAPNSCILTEKEKIELYTYMAGSKKELSDKNFNAQPRKPFFIECKRLGKIEPSPVDNFRWRCGEVDKIDFKVSKKVIIHGILVFGGRLDKATYKVSAWLRRHDNDEVVADFHSKVYTKKEVETYQVFFRKPAEVVPDRKYCIHLQMKGPKSYWSEEGYQLVTCHDIVFRFLNSVEDSNGTNVGRGQIPGIIFTKYPIPSNDMDC